MENGIATDETSDARLSYYLQQFWDSVDATREAREHAEFCRDYYDGRQWTDKERKTLEKRRQPCITDNRIKDKVDHLLGMERQTRTDPKAYPRTPMEESAAEAATDALRYVSDCEHFQQTKSKVFDNMLVEGTGGAEVVVEKKVEYIDVKIRHIRWDRIYYDPHSLSPDFSDASYSGIVAWMDLDKAKVKYPALSGNFDRLMDGTLQHSTGETYDDKPDMWVDRRRKRVQIIEHYHQESGTWMRCVFSRAGVIEKAQPCVYLDQDGTPENPMILQSTYVERKGDRYGVVRRYLDPQDEVNKRRSKALHLISNQRAIAEKGAVDDVEKTRVELARPDGVVEVSPGMRFDVVENRDLAQGQFLLLQDALNTLASVGPNAALQGQKGDSSGRSQEIAQQAGTVQLGPLFDSVRYWQKRVMQAVWNRVRQYWTDEMWIRVTDDNKTYFVALNQRITKGELEAERLKDAQMSDEEKQARIQQLAQDPASQQPVTKNDVAKMNMDIVIDEAPDVVVLQQEQWIQLTELAKSGVPIPPQTLIQASTLRNKESLIADMAQMGPGIPPEAQKQLDKAQGEIEQRAKQVEAQEQQLKDLENSIKEQTLALKLERGELEASRKLFQADVKVAKAEIRAEKITAAADIQTKATTAAAGLAAKETQLQSKTVTAGAQIANKQTQLSTKQAQLRAQQQQAKAKSSSGAR